MPGRAAHSHPSSAALPSSDTPTHTHTHAFNPVQASPSGLLLARIQAALCLGLAPAIAARAHVYALAVLRMARVARISARKLCKYIVDFFNLRQWLTTS
jgi:hypothetical protein